MPEPLEADLELSISSALGSVDDLRSQIESSLNDAVSAFDDAFSAAIQGVPPVALDFDTSDAATQLALFNDDVSEPVVKPLDLDTDEAVAAVEELGSSASESSAGVGDMDDALSGLQASSGLATGSVGALGNALSGVSGEAAVAVGALVAISAATNEMFHEALDAQSSAERFTLALGGMADKVEHLDNIKGLNTTLQELALKLGTDDDALRQVISTQVQLATASGKSRKEAADYAQTLAVMAARAVALNPTLGGVDTVASSLGQAFARGSRIAARFQLDLRSTEITARALENTGKATAGELTQIEKSMAGAQLATEKYGKSLSGDIAKGSANVIFTFKELKQEVRENIETLGKPLVAPILDLMRAAVPTFQAAGSSIATLAQSGLPVLTIALEAVAPPLQVIAALLQAIPTPILGVITTMVAFNRVMSISSSLLGKAGLGGIASSAAIDLGKFGSAAATVGGALPRLAAGAFGVSVALQDMNGTTDDAAQGILEMAASGAVAGSSFGPWGTAIGAAAGGIAGLTNALITGGESVEEYRKHFVALASTLDSLSSGAALKQFIDTLGDTDRVSAGLDKVSGSLAGVTTRVDTASRSLVVVKPNIKAITNEFEALARTSPAAAGKVLDALRNLHTESGKPLFNAKEIGELELALAKSEQQFTNLNRRKQQANAINDALAGSESHVAAAVHDTTAETIDSLDAIQKSIDLKHQQVDALTAYLDALLAEQDKQFAATKAAQDAADAEQNLIDVNKDSTKTELEKQIALNDAITANEKAAIAAGEAAVATMEGADANAIAKAKIDATVSALELQKASVEVGSPLWNAIDAYQKKIMETPQYWITHLDLVVSAFSGAAGGAEVNRLGASVGGAPSEPPIGARGMLVPAVPGGMLIRAGEAGHPEILVPTDDRTRAMALLEQGGLGDLVAPPPSPSVARPAPVSAGTAGSVDNSITIESMPILARVPDPTSVGIASARALRRAMYLGGRSARRDEVATQ